MTEPIDVDIQSLSADEFAALVADHDDDTLLATFRAIGTGRALDRIFADMEAHARPEKIKGTDATVQWHVTDDGEQHSYVVELSPDGSCSTRRGEADEPDTTLKIDLARFARVAAGQASGVKLLLTRKLKASGDVNLARKLESFFSKPSP